MRALVRLTDDEKAKIAEVLKTRPPTPAERNAFIKGLREKAKIELGDPR